jgi:hypothetical protein
LAVGDGVDGDGEEGIVAGMAGEAGEVTCTVSPIMADTADMARSLITVDTARTGVIRPAIGGKKKIFLFFFIWMRGLDRAIQEAERRVRRCEQQLRQSEARHQALQKKLEQTDEALKEALIQEIEETISDMVERAKTVSNKKLREMRESVKHTFPPGALIHRVSEQIFADEMERRKEQAEIDRRREMERQRQQKKKEANRRNVPHWLTPELREACRVGGFSDPFEMD